MFLSPFLLIFLLKPRVSDLAFECFRRRRQKTELKFCLLNKTNLDDDGFESLSTAKKKKLVTDFVRVDG
jgi:hypothetical protein